MMNKKLILAIALLLLGNALVAQNHEDTWVWPDDMKTDVLSIHLDAAPVIGGGMAFATNPTIIQADFGSGFCYQLGVAVNGRLSYLLSPQPHGISRLGVGVEALLNNTFIKAEGTTLNMMSLAFPIMIHCYVTSDLILEAGATLVKSFKTNPEWSQFGPIMVNTGNIRCNDVMVSAGACYKTPIGLAFDLRYNHGNSNMSQTVDSKTSTVVFSVSYRFTVIK